MRHRPGRPSNRTQAEVIELFHAVARGEAFRPTFSKRETSRVREPEPKPDPPMAQDRFDDLLCRYLADKHDLHLPSGYRWDIRPATARCGEGTCEWDVLDVYTVTPDGQYEWQEHLEGHFLRDYGLPELIKDLAAYEEGTNA